MKKILVLQIEDRLDDKLQKFMDHNKKVCLKNNFKYVFITKSFDIPPYWAKIFELQKLMNENLDIDYFFWLDSDAFFINFDNEKFQNFLEKYNDYSIIISEDIPPWETEFNAGSFIIKNNEISRDIIKKWISYYNPDNWKYENDKWITNSTWAGDDYEQGSFINNILPVFNKDIIKLNYNVLNNNNCESNHHDTISVHLAGSYKNDDDIYQKCTSLFEGFTSCSYVNNNYYWITSFLNILSIIIITFILLLISKLLIIYAKKIKNKKL